MGAFIAGALQCSAWLRCGVPALPPQNVNLGCLAGWLLSTKDSERLSPRSWKRCVTAKKITAKHLKTPGQAEQGSGSGRRDSGCEWPCGPAIRPQAPTPKACKQTVKQRLHPRVIAASLPTAKRRGRPPCPLPMNGRTTGGLHRQKQCSAIERKDTCSHLGDTWKQHGR